MAVVGLTRRPLVHVVFLGVRGSVCAPGPGFVRYGGNTSCLAMSTASGEPPTLLLDAGTGIRTATGMLRGNPFRGTILVSHVHWDHVQGLPFFSAGDRAGASVRLASGPLADTIGVLERLDSAGRARVLVAIMSGEVRVSVPAKDLLAA